MNKDIEERIIFLTNNLRNSKDNFYSVLRSKFSEKNVDTSKSALLEVFSDDVAFEFGVILTPERRVIQFGYDYLHKQFADGEFREWNVLSGANQYKEDVEIGNHLLDNNLNN